MTRQEALEALTSAIEDYIATGDTAFDQDQLAWNARDAEEVGRQIGQDALKTTDAPVYIECMVNAEGGWNADELKIISCAAYYEVACQKEDNHVG